MKFGIRVTMLMFLLDHHIWVKRQQEIHSLDLSRAKKSPPVQVMGKSDDEDPNGIPSSISQRTNTATPMEWSVASNESLFSIHMGNSSFSEDQAFLVGKSQELAFPNSPLNATPPLIPSAASRPCNLQQPGAAKAMNAVMRAAAEGCFDKERTLAEVEPRSTTSTSRRSDGSVCSFAFPLLSGEGRDGSIKEGPDNQLTETKQRIETPKGKQMVLVLIVLPILSLRAVIPV